MDEKIRAAEAAIPACKISVLALTHSKNQLFDALGQLKSCEALDGFEIALLAGEHESALRCFSKTKRPLH